MSQDYFSSPFENGLPNVGVLIHAHLFIPLSKAADPPEVEKKIWGYETQ